MSRRPKPSALRELEGNAGHRPLNDCELKPPTGVPEMPKGLRKTAQREWWKITELLEALRVISRVDGKALAMYCDAYADWEEAQRQCVKEGMWYSEPVISKQGECVGYKHKAAPWFVIKVTAMKVMKSFLIEFGLTPASRAKLRIDPPKPEESFPERDQTAPASDDIDLSSIDETVIN